MRLKTMLFAALLGIFPTMAAAADSQIALTSITGTVQIMKNGQVIMELTENDTVPQNLDSGVTIKVLTGSTEIKVGNNVTVTGPAGSVFSLSATNNSATITSAAGTPVEAKDNVGNTYVFTQNSAVTFAQDDKGFTVSVGQGRVLQSNAKGDTTIIGSGESVVLTKSAQKQEPQVISEKKKTSDEPADDTNDEILTQIIPPAPATNVIPTKEETESEHVVSRSAP